MKHTIEAAVRAMTRPERVAHLRAHSWERIGYSGAQAWRSPDPEEHATFYTLAAAIREQLRREHRAALPQFAGLPVVPLKREEAWADARGDMNNHWVIDCPYCGREHFHGPGPGHRESHCLRGDGYVIEHPADDGGDDHLLELPAGPPAGRNEREDDQ
jgi:hypothetical protein